MNLPRQNTPSSPSPANTSHKATMSSPLPENYKKVVQSLIHRSDISVEVKIDLWKRFAEYEACVDEEEHLADEEEPVFTATTTKATVGKVGPDFQMPVPWMRSESSDSEDGDSGYEGNGSNSIGGDENIGGEENNDDGEHTDGVDMMDTAEESVEEIIITSGSGSDQGSRSDKSSNESDDGNGSPGAMLPPLGPENNTTATTTITNNTNQEPQAADNTITTANTSNQKTQAIDNTTTAPKTTTAATTAPAPSNNLTRVRHDIRTYFSHLAERERLLCTREKWVTSRAEALWQNAEVLTGILRREFDGRGRKRVLREFEKGGESRKGVVEGCGEDGERRMRSRRG
ncbi:hypothetical protein O988_09288 [Pseudogymnoascus sp. VKM F-3808]|nr:hypothetical protein O988_09288 [Pseudogymnoascus sp. VKM F-3808]